MSSDNKIGKFRQGQIGVGSQGVCIQISEEITHRVVLQKKGKISQKACMVVMRVEKCILANPVEDSWPR